MKFKFWSEKWSQNTCKIFNYLLSDEILKCLIRQNHLISYNKCQTYVLSIMINVQVFKEKDPIDFYHLCIKYMRWLII